LQGESILNFVDKHRFILPPLIHLKTYDDLIEEFTSSQFLQVYGDHRSQYRYFAAGLNSMVTEGLFLTVANFCELWWALLGCVEADI